MKHKKWYSLIAMLAGLTMALPFFLSSAPSAAKKRGAAPYAVVFTSRTEPVALRATLPPPSRTYPGTRIQRASAGKLRVLEPSGAVRELTWGKHLPDGSTLIDVMSPSVSQDGKKVVFAGIVEKTAHFHIYEAGIDGKVLRRITGGSGDQGCVGLPYLKYGPDQKKLSMKARKRMDFDDLDPAYLPDGRIVFVSTRQPAVSLFGGGRVTNLWVMNSDGSDKHQITFNLSGERWPYVLKDGRIIFSYWSRTLTRATESGLISAETEKELQDKAMQKGVKLLTGQLPNNWWPAVVNPDGTDFRAITKPASSSAHPRPLFNGNIVYATSAERSLDSCRDSMWLEQVPPGLIGLASGGRIQSDQAFPRQENGIIAGPGSPAWKKLSRNGMSCSLPAAMPGGYVIFSARPEGRPDYGLYMAADHWSGTEPAELIELFDEAGSCDGEAQAVYARRCLVRKDQDRPNLKTLKLASGKKYRGPAGGVSSPDIYLNPVEIAPGQKTDSGEGPLFVPPPRGLIKSIEFYMVKLERNREGLPSGKISLELAARSKVKENGGFFAEVPAGVPLMQIGRDGDGRVASWQGTAKDSKGHSAAYAAFAGDHFGYATQGIERNFCVGCHAGHTVMPGKGLADVLDVDDKTAAD